MRLSNATSDFRANINLVERKIGGREILMTHSFKHNSQHRWISMILFFKNVLSNGQHEVPPHFNFDLSYQSNSTTFKYSRRALHGLVAKMSSYKGKFWVPWRELKGIFFKMIFFFMTNMMYSFIRLQINHRVILVVMRMKQWYSGQDNRKAAVSIPRPEAFLQGVCVLPVGLSLSSSRQANWRTTNCLPVQVKIDVCLHMTACQGEASSQLSCIAPPAFVP